MNASSKIVTFNNPTFGDTRTVKIEGSVYFVGKDSTNALKYRNSNDAIKRHCKDWGVKRYPIPDALGRIRETVVIDQANLLRLITHSKLPEAQKFEAWIFEGVIPTVLSTGSYSVEQTKKLEAVNNHIAKLEKELEEQYVLSRNFDRMLDIFKRKIEETVSLQEEVDRLKAKQTRALPAPKIGAAEGTMSTVQAAKLLQMHYPFVNRDWVIYTLRNADCMCQNSCEPTANGIRWGIVVPKLDVYFKNGVKTIGRQYSHITSNGFDWLAKVAKRSAEKELV